MYLKHFHLAQPPFLQEPDQHFLFQDIERETLSRSLLTDILQGPPLVKLIGAEGTGKTFLCRLISDQLPQEYEVIHIDNPVGAFDDLIRIICLGLGLNLADKNDTIDPVEELFYLLKSSKNKGKKTVLIIDEAEKTFLATLERLIRFSCQNDQDLALTLLLSGRPDLQANLQRLTVFYSKVGSGPEYTLEPLNEEQTGHYLRFRLKAASPDGEEDNALFTEAAVARIFQASRGNLQIINRLAEKSLQEACSQQASQVLPSHVLPPSGYGVRKKNPLLAAYELLGRPTRVVATALAGIVLLVVLIGFLTGTDKREEVASAGATEQRTAAAPTEQDHDTLGKDHDPTAPVSRSEQETTALQIPAKETPQPETDTPRDGEAIFQERLRASAGWVAGAYRGEHTIQLLQLTSDQVEAETADVLVEDAYYEARNQLYILRKNITPPSIHIFYGLYGTMDEAREARNSLPATLRKQHPHPLAISEALELLQN